MTKLQDMIDKCVKEKLELEILAMNANDPSISIIDEVTGESSRGNNMTPAGGRGRPTSISGRPGMTPLEIEELVTRVL